MGSDEFTVPDTVARLARYDKSSGNRHDDDSHDGGQDSGRRANASGTLGEIAQAPGPSIAVDYGTSRSIDGHSLTTAVSTIGLRGPLRHPFVLVAQAETTQITIAGLLQTC